jgi:hypothetical protein
LLKALRKYYSLRIPPGRRPLPEILTVSHGGGRRK